MRVAIVSDNANVVQRLCQALHGRDKHEMVWVALSAAEAIERCANSKPDVILLDLLVQHGIGVAVTEEIMHAYPCPILIVSDDIAAHAGIAFEAMGAGALDAVEIPLDEGAGADQRLGQFLQKLETIGKLVRYAQIGIESLDRTASLPSTNPNLPMVAIGASSGGPQAIADIIGRLPAAFPAAIVVVQHVDDRFARELAAWLAGKSQLTVRTAVAGDVPKAGCVFIAETNDHLILDPAGHLNYQQTPKENVFRPSVDVFFASVAEHWRGDVAGILLTGMGDDGARGLLTLREHGHLTIAQDEVTSAVYGMPKAARAIRAAVKVLPLWGISAELISWSQHRVRRV